MRLVPGTLWAAREVQRPAMLPPHRHRSPNRLNRNKQVGEDRADVSHSLPDQTDQVPESPTMPTVAGHP